MRVRACDPYPDKCFSPDGDFAYCSFDELLTRADIISLHCPPKPDGTPLIDGAAVTAMKAGVHIVNTARGSLLDDDAVLAGLESGKIAGVTVDAFRSEPPDDWRLVRHARVTATPHFGGFTEESVARAMSVAVENLPCVLEQK